MKHIKHNSSVRCRQSKTEVRCHPGQEGWENSSLRKSDGLLSLEERRTCKTPQKYKGRVVLRGDNSKDEEGHSAVCTEQGASVSQMAAAKFLDTISKLLGMAATSAYIQVKMTDVFRLLLPKDECVKNCTTRFIVLWNDQ